MIVTDEDDIVAAELALGLLDGEEQKTIEARAEADPAFGSAVELWRQRFAPMLTHPAETPPDRVWEAIAARLAANDDAPLSAAEAALRRWRAFGLSASAIAASLALVLVTRSPVEAPRPAPVPAQQQPAPIMVATLQGEGSPAVVTISADPDGRLLVTPVGMTMADRVPELWIIPSDGTPRSLGLIQAGGPSMMKVAPARMAYLRRGATLAISEEPPGGSPTGAPTGAVIASGKIDIV